MTTKNGIIYGVDGGTLFLRGVTWYGFDNGTTLNGLQVLLSSLLLSWAAPINRKIKR
jgi:hypothetical protein